MDFTLSEEDPLEEGMATESSVLAWRMPWTVFGSEELALSYPGSQGIYVFLWKRQISRSFHLNPLPLPDFSTNNPPAAVLFHRMSRSHSREERTWTETQHSVILL